MGFRWAAPRLTVAGVSFVEAAHAARGFVRRVAEENFEALTESEYREATKGQQAEVHQPELIDFDNDQGETIAQSASDDSVQDACMESRTIILHCRNIRASRNLGQIEAIGGSIPQLSHWCVEVRNKFLDNISCNLLLTTVERFAVFSANYAQMMKTPRLPLSKTTTESFYTLSSESEIERSSWR